MSAQQDDLLLSLQSSLRNALCSFGRESSQYQTIKYMVDEHILARAALQRSEKLASTKDGIGGQHMTLVFRPKTS